jgi:hypothetical protein
VKGGAGRQCQSPVGKPRFPTYPTPTARLSNCILCIDFIRLFLKMFCRALQCTRTWTCATNTSHPMSSITTFPPSICSRQTLHTLLSIQFRCLPYSALDPAAFLPPRLRVPEASPHVTTTPPRLIHTPCTPLSSHTPPALWSLSNSSGLRSMESSQRPDHATCARIALLVPQPSISPRPAPEIHQTS